MLFYDTASYKWIFLLFLKLNKTVALDTGLCWTDWINKHQTQEGVDKEILVQSDQYVYGVCKRPLAVDVARLDGLPVKEKLNCQYNGCICRDINQKPGVKCSDYMVRFLCLCHDLYPKRDPPYQSILICHDAENKTFSCPPNTVVSVKSAYYGTIWLSQCGFGILNSVCRKESKEVLREIKTLCESKSNCTIFAPPRNYGGPNCGIVRKHLHVELNCAESCERDGKTFFTGNEYIDDACTVRCTCVKGGRFVCIPLCPVKYGVVCPNKGVVRFREKEVSTNPNCSCLVPTCSSPRSFGCKLNDKFFAPGQKVESKLCKEECQCVGHHRWRCKPLCNDQKCKKSEEMKVSITKAAFSGCL